MEDLEATDTGAQAEIIAVASAITSLGEVIRQCETTAQARGILIEACELLSRCATDASSLIGDSVPESLNALLGRTPQMKLAKQRKTQLERVKRFFQERENKQKPVAIGKAAIIELERFAIDAMLEDGKSYSEIADYLQHTYKEVIERERLAPFKRADVFNKLKRDGRIKKDR